MNSPTPHSRSTVRVRYAETDQMGVAYHAHYLVWCEVGRTDLIRGLGPSYAQIEREGIRLAVAEANIRYARPARYDDVVIVETRLEKVQSRTLDFAYTLVRGEGDRREVLATAHTTLVALDHDGRPHRLPGAVRDLFAGLGG